MADPRSELDELRAQVASLTARVYQLELARSGTSARPVRPVAPAVPDAPPVVETAPPAAPITSPVPSPTSVLPPPVLPSLSPLRSPLNSTTRGEGDLEKKIGQYWLNRVGIAAMLIGVSYFLKFAFENNWIGPGGRIAIGLLAGIALILWSETFRARGHLTFSYSLKAVGIGTLYLSLWGAFQVYHLIPAPAAFVAMMLVTASTIALALSQDAELLASFAMIGGFATPVLLSTGQNHEVALFSYVALLDIAILAMAVVKPWRRLLWGSFAGTLLLYCGWFIGYYHSYRSYAENQRPVTVFFATLFAAIFAIVPLATRYERSTTSRGGPSITLTVLPLLNAAVYFLQLFVMYDSERTTLTWFALALGAAYLGIANAFKRRFPGEDTRVINLLHVAIAIAFITIAIPLKLDAQWITIGWLIESAVLLWISSRTRTNFLRSMAVAALTLGIVRLLLYDRFTVDTLIFNARFLTYVIAIAILAGVAIVGGRDASEREKPLLALAVILVNVLALIAVTAEASDYFLRQMSEVGQVGNEWTRYHELNIVRSFTYSAIWLIYGAGLMAFGFRTRSAFARWQALILIAFTTGKIFLYDVSQLGGSYRILSFIALGAVLLGISFIYQRDWLKLSSRSSGNSAEEPSQ